MTPTESPPTSYEAACSEIEMLLQQMESDQLPLDQLQAACLRAHNLIQYCRAQLQTLEQQLTVLTITDPKQAADS